jgi:hypothetical protein
MRVDEGNKINPLWELMKEKKRFLMGVNEGNKSDSLWELMKEIRGSCIIHDYTCWIKIVGYL